MKKLHRFIAFINRTFVADCPVCHKHFYGHQAYETQVVINQKHYRIVCHRCKELSSGKKARIEDR